MNSIYVLLVVITIGNNNPRPTGLSHEFSSKDKCELAKKELMTQGANPSWTKEPGMGMSMLIATCTPK